jgi:ketosteroid isomerase-like protein
MTPRSSLLAACALLLAAGCAPARFPAAGGEHRLLERREASFLAALAARNLEQTLAHYTDDAVLHIAGFPPIRGREEIARFYGNVFRALQASSATPEMTRLAPGGEMAYSTGRVVNVFPSEHGPVEHAGKYLLVWERHAGGWLVAAYALSSDAPAPGRTGESPRPADRGRSLP